jgi:hypothetical protein
VNRDDDEARATSTFLRGLTIGALIGAVLAGSSIWSRRRRSAAHPDDPPPIPADRTAPLNDVTDPAMPGVEVDSGPDHPS